MSLPEHGTVARSPPAATRSGDRCLEDAGDRVVQPRVEVLVALLDRETLGERPEKLAITPWL
jgi:hypothetical protein